MTLPADVENKGREFIRADSEVILAQHQLNHSKTMLERAENVRDEAVKNFGNSDGLKLNHKESNYILVSGKTLRVMKTPTGVVTINIIRVQQ